MLMVHFNFEPNEKEGYACSVGCCQGYWLKYYLCWIYVMEVICC